MKRIKSKLQIKRHTKGIKSISETTFRTNRIQQKRFQRKIEQLEKDSIRVASLPTTRKVIAEPPKRDEVNYEVSMSNQIFDVNFAKTIQSSF